MSTASVSPQIKTEATVSRDSLDVVIPVYNEEKVLPELFRRLDAVLGSLPLKTRVIYVDDGSTDRTPEILDAEHRSKSNVEVLHFSRNFGPQAAHRAGVSESLADAVVFLDADLQDPPEILPQMIEKWKSGADVVICQRRSRAETGLRGLCFRVFHSLYAKITDNLIPPDSGVFGLIGRNAVEALKSCPETNLFLPGLRGWVGFRQEIIVYDRKDREAGETKQSFWKLLRYAWSAIASFSTVPLKAILSAGVVICIICVLYATSLIGIRILQVFGEFEGWRVPGFTTLAVATFFLGGVQLMSLGIIGEYLSKVYDECKRRPPYIVKKRLPPAKE